MEVTLAFIGDVMLGREVDPVIEALGPESIWGNTLETLRSADARFANLECALTTHDQRWTQTPKAFHFRAPPSAVKALQAAGIDAVSLANNHILDFGNQGLTDTLVTLNEAGIEHAGAGLGLTQVRQPTIFRTRTAPPVTLAFIAITDNEPPFAAGPEKPGTNYFPMDLDVAELDAIDRAIDEARTHGADIVILSNHCGPNMIEEPSFATRRFAQAVIDRGVDVYFGHSAHVFQGVEIYKGKPIFYDTGDFIDDYAVDPNLRNDWSFVFKTRFEGRILREIELVPVRLNFARANLAQGTERENILRKMQKLSAEFGTFFDVDNGRLISRRDRAA